MGRRMVDNCVHLSIVFFAIPASLCMCLQAWIFSGGAATSGVRVALHTDKF